jgi:hypothetical protein
MSWILTSCGHQLDFLSPSPSSIYIADIATGLANECRFSGQCRVYYSVAQHSVLVSHIVPPEFALEALLHDAADAYCKDIPSPLKALLPGYLEIERRLQRAINARFGVSSAAADGGAMSYHVWRADLTALATERRDLMPHGETPWPQIENVLPLEDRIYGEGPAKAWLSFLNRFNELNGKAC